MTREKREVVGISYFSRAEEQVTANLVEDRSSLSRLRAGVRISGTDKICGRVGGLLRGGRSASFGGGTIAATVEASGERFGDGAFVSRAIEPDAALGVNMR